MALVNREPGVHAENTTASGLVSGVGDFGTWDSKICYIG